MALSRTVGYSSIGKSDFANTPAKPLPKELQIRKKTGFSVPVYAWHERVESSSSNQNFESGRRKWARALLAKNGVAV